MTVSSRLTVDLGWTHIGSADLSSVKDEGRRKFENLLTDGDGDNKAENMWHDRRELTPSTGTDDLDLNGSLTNVFGETLNFTKIKKLAIFNLGEIQSDGTFTPTANAELLVGAAASNAWSQLFDGSATSKIFVGSGGMLIVSAPLTAGIPVTAGSSDVLRVNIGGSATVDVTYDIVIIGN